MKCVNIIILITIIFCACIENKKEKERIIESANPCLSGFVLMVYLGETNHPIYPFVIMTNEKDSTYYHMYMSDGKKDHDIEKLNKYGFLMTDFPRGRSTMNAVVDNGTYNILKKYILKSNTNKDLNYWSNDNSAIRIILKDQCDSISYAINREDTAYFKNLLEITYPYINQNLRKGLEYYGRLQIPYTDMDS